MNKKNHERLAQLERALKDGCSVFNEVMILWTLIDNKTTKKQAWEEIKIACNKWDIFKIRQLITYIENYE